MASGRCKLPIKGLENRGRDIKAALLRIQLQKYGVAGKSRLRWERFATFLLRNVTYETLLQTIQRSCSSLAHLGQNFIRLRYKDEDGDIQNPEQIYKSYSVP